MPLDSNENVKLFDNCKSLHNLILTFHVTLDLITSGNNGFTLQLNCYPQTSPQATYKGNALNWFQYVIAVVNNTVEWGIQYWSVHSGHGFTPTPNYAQFATAPLNQVKAGSVMRIALTTDTGGHVTSATFSITDPAGTPSSHTFTFPSDCLCAIYGCQANLIGPPILTHKSNFTSGLGVLTYWVSEGTLSVQGENTCGGIQRVTSETSNSLYGDLVPPSAQETFQLVVA